MRNVRGLAVVLQFWVILRVWGTVYYVTATRSDQGDGLSWETAAASVQSVLDRASPGDQVWIASGIYHPTEERQDASGNSPALTSFLLRDGVSIYGGFSGSERSLDERILEDSDGNGLLEAWEFSAETVLSGVQDGSGQVLYGGMEPFSLPVTIDGFSICNGRASGSGRDGEGGGAHLPGNCTLQRCRIYANHARRGGGAAVFGANTVRQCLFQNNELTMDGWAGEGAGVFLQGEGAVLENCLVVRNGHDSGGAYLGGGGVAVCGAGQVDSCTVVGNFSVGAGTGVRFSGTGGLLNNSVIWGNQGNACQLSNGEALLQNSAVESCSELPGCLALSIFNCGESGPAVNENRVHGYYPCFVEPEQGNFRLGAGSYLLNRAQTTPAFEDAACRPRGNSPWSDIGCYEEDLPGNLTGDFMLSVPLVYAESATLAFRPGLATPDGVEAGFSSGNAQVDWQCEGASQWTLTCLQAGNVNLILNLFPSPEIAPFWNAFALQRSLLVQPRCLLLKADDMTWQWGSSAPVLTWQIISGELAGGDEIVGSLQSPEPDRPGQYPIEQGSLRVSDRADGANHQLEVLPGILTCIKGNCQILLASLERTYSGYEITPAVETDPVGLPAVLTYEGIEGTQYPLSSNAPVNAGRYRVSALVDDDCYSGVASTLLVIHPAPLFCCAVDQVRDYLFENPPLTIQYDGFLGNDCVDDITEPIASTSAERLSPVCESGYEILLQGGSARNYRLELRNGRLMIRKVQPMFNEVLLSSGVYGMPLKQILIMAYAISPVDGSFLPGDFIWEQGEQVLHAGLWQCVWRFLPEDLQNYQSMSGSSLVTIQKREVRVAAQTGQKTYGDCDPVIKYQVTAGSLAAGDAFSGNPERTPGENAGQYAIGQGSLTLTDNYEMLFAGNDFQILPRRILVQAEDASKYEGQSDPSFLWTCVGDGLVGDDHFSGTLQRFPGEEPGQYPILQGDLNLSENYILDFEPGTLTILPPAYRLVGDLIVTSPVYGQPLSGDLIQGTVEIAATGEVASGHFCWEEEGSLPAAGMLNANWIFVPEQDLGLPLLTGCAEVQVDQAQLRVSCKGDLRRDYGQDNPHFELAYDGFVLEDDESVLLQQPVVTCIAEPTSLPGEYPIVIEGGRAENYDLEFLPCSLCIDPLQIQVQADNLHKTFSAPDPLLTYSWQGALLEEDAFSGQLQRQPGEEPGSYQIGQGTLSLPPYYQLTFSPGLLQIGLISLTVKADDQTMYYGGRLPDLSWQIVSGALQMGDLLSGSLSCVWNNQPGTYEISQGSLRAHSKYQLTFLPGILQVLPRPLTIQATDTEKTYSVSDSAKPLTWKMIEGSLYQGDTVIGQLQREPGEEPGEYRIVRGTLDVTPAENYQLTFLEGVFTIRKIIPHGYAFPLDVIYHGDLLSKVHYLYHFFDSLSNDELPGTCYFVNGNMRMRKGTSSEMLIFSPEDDAHFEQKSTTILVQIRIRALDVILEDKSMTYGDPLPELTWDFGDYELFPDEEITGELTLVDASSGEAVDKNSRLPVGEYRILPGTLQAPSENYYSNYQEGRLTVQKRAVAVRALDTGKTAGTPDPALTLEIIAGSIAAGDCFSGNLLRVSGEQPGTYPIRQGTLGLNSNYDLTFSEGAFTIAAAKARSGVGTGTIQASGIMYPSLAGILDESQLATEDLLPDQSSIGYPEPDMEPVSSVRSVPLPLQVQALSAEKIYGEPDPPLQYRVLNGGESSAVLQGQLQRQSGEDAGTYSIGQGTLHCPGGEQLQFIPGTLRILPGKITVRALQQQKYQGEMDPVFTWEFVGSERSGVQVAGRLTRRKGEYPGAYEIQQGSLQIAGRNAVLEYEPAVFTILPPAYVAREVNAENLIFGQELREARLTGEVIFTEGQELQLGEFVWQQPERMLSSGQHIVGWDFIFADADIVPLQGECILEVLPKSIEIKSLPQAKRQGEQDPQLLFQYAPMDFPEGTPTITGKLSRESGESPGVYQTRLGTLNFGSDYHLQFTPASLLIQADSIVVNAAWKVSRKSGESIEFAGKTWRFGSDALADLSEALERIAPDGKIMLLPGEYTSTSTNWMIARGVHLQGLTLEDRFPVLKSTVQILGATVENVTIEGLAFSQEKQEPGSSSLIIGEGASTILVRDCVFLGGNPAIQAHGISDLTLRNNLIESPYACLMFGHPAENHNSSRGVLLQQNVLRPSPEADNAYRHILLYDDNINTTGILPAWNNCFGECQITGNEKSALLNEIKRQIADKEQKGWLGKGEVRLRK